MDRNSLFDSSVRRGPEPQESAPEKIFGNRFSKKSSKNPEISRISSNFGNYRLDIRIDMVENKEYICVIKCIFVSYMDYQGSHNLSVDGKGRVVIPVSYREQLHQQFDGKLVIGQTFRFPCISIYPAPEFDRIREELLRNRNATMQFQNLMRTIVGSAHKCDMLASGRILLPKQLREFNSIEKDAVLIGMGTRFELWDHNEFNSHNSGINSGTDEEYQEILEKLTI